MARTATNPETGERFELVDNEWVSIAPPTSPETSILDSIGQPDPDIDYTGGGRGRLGYIADTPAFTERMNTAEPADVAAASVLSAPLAGSSIGLGAILGGVTGYMGAEEGQGALGTTVGAILGGPVGRLADIGISKAAGAVVPYAKKTIGGMYDQASALVKGTPVLDEPLGLAASESPALQALRERALQVTGRVARPGTRALGEDFATVDELASIGFPVTTAEAQHNLAKTGTDELTTALKNMDIEQKSMSGPTGRKVLDIKAQQKRAATDYVAARLGLEPGQALTPNVLADVYQGAGAKFDEFAASMGAVDITDAMPALEKVQKNALSDSKAGIDSIVGDIKQMSERNGGRLTGQDWQKIRTDIVDMQQTGTRQQAFGKISDSSDLMDVLTGAMEDQLPEVAKGELRDLRHTYALLSTASKGAATDKDGLVNVGTLARNWRKPQSNKYKGKDEVGKMLNAFATYTPSRVPDSGTAGRLLQAAQAANIPGSGVLGTVSNLIR